MRMQLLLYLLRPKLHIGDPRGVHHWFGPSQGFYDTLPLRWQPHEAALGRVERRVDAVFEIPWRRDLRPPLLLAPKHSETAGRAKGEGLG